MKKIYALVMLILFAATVQAGELSFRDSETGLEIKNAVLSINLNNNEMIKFLNDNGKIELNPSKGQILEITADLVETTGKDYYTKIEYDNEEEIILFPIASVRGIVKDSLDNIVGFAELKCACKPLPKINHPEKTDKFGTFSTIVAAGKCKIYASYKNALGFKEIFLQQGELKDIEIKLDKTIVSVPKKKYAQYGIVALIGAIIFAVIFAYTQKKTKSLLKKKNEKQNTPKRSQDILKTLNSKEKEIVNFLEMNQGKSTQAGIRHNTGIPRTSLSRLINGLENKNIIKVRKEGKAVKISLTDWFMEKG